MKAPKKGAAATAANRHPKAIEKQLREQAQKEKRRQEAERQADEQFYEEKDSRLLKQVKLKENRLKKVEEQKIKLDNKQRYYEEESREDVSPKSSTVDQIGKKISKLEIKELYYSCKNNNDLEAYDNFDVAFEVKNHNVNNISDVTNVTTPEMPKITTFSEYCKLRRSQLDGQKLNQSQIQAKLWKEYKREFKQ
ncbi:MAG: hypothetical protein MHMPM18_001842 [Marteilia pararefringens]